MSIAPGQQVGNYQVLSRLGVGGMGAVYLAEHPIIGKKVALKVIHRELAGNREVISRFYQEARAVNLIGNEHIVEIHDFGQSPEGDHFFIMEYVDGKTLAQVLTRERILEVGRALHIAAQICDALGAAHDAGIIHRDLKPDNVMLCGRPSDPDFVKLLDFGLAKMMAEGSQKLTAAGVILGTPQYMSPEACESKKVDHRADIYALGVLLFQMLTGQVPFDGESMGSILIKQVIEAPPAPRGLSPMIPPAVEQIILRCLAKSPAARFATMGQLRDALMDPDRYLESSPPMMPAAQPSAAAQATTMYAVGTNAALGMQATAALPAANTRALGLAGAAQLGSAATAAISIAAPSRPTATGGAQQHPTMLVDAMFGGPTQQVNHGATMIVAAAPADPPRASAMASYPTAPPRPAELPMPRYPTAPPLIPQVPQNQTMVIATPVGYSSRPPRSKALPWVIVGLAVALVAGVTAVVVVGNGDDPDPIDRGSAEAPDAAAVVGSSVSASEPDAGVGASPAADAAVAIARARVTITSEPKGAEVLDTAGAVLGITPTTIDLPADGVDRTLTFRRSGSKERTKTIAVTGDMTVSVLLDPEASPGGSPGSGGRSGSGRRTGSGSGAGGGTGRGTGSNNDIMEPDLSR